MHLIQIADVHLTQKPSKVRPHQFLFRMTGQLGGDRIGKFNLIALVEDDNTIVPHFGNLLQTLVHFLDMLLNPSLLILLQSSLQVNHPLS